MVAAITEKLGWPAAVTFLEAHAADVETRSWQAAGLVVMLSIVMLTAQSKAVQLRRAFHAITEVSPFDGDRERFWDAIGCCFQFTKFVLIGRCLQRGGEGALVWMVTFGLVAGIITYYEEIVSQCKMPGKNAPPLESVGGHKDLPNHFKLVRWGFGRAGHGGGKAVTHLVICLGLVSTLDLASFNEMQGAFGTVLKPATSLIGLDKLLADWSLVVPLFLVASILGVANGTHFLWFDKLSDRILHLKKPILTITLLLGLLMNIKQLLPAATKAWAGASSGLAAIEGFKGSCYVAGISHLASEHMGGQEPSSALAHVIFSSIGSGLLGLLILATTGVDAKVSGMEVVRAAFADALAKVLGYIPALPVVGGLAGYVPWLTSAFVFAMGFYYMVSIARGATDLAKVYDGKVGGLEGYRLYLCESLLCVALLWNLNVETALSLIVSARGLTVLLLTLSLILGSQNNEVKDAAIEADPDAEPAVPEEKEEEAPAPAPAKPKSAPPKSGSRARSGSPKSKGKK